MYFCISSKNSPMKKLLPILLLTSLLLSACNFNWSNKEDLFQKKQECWKLNKILEERIDKNSHGETNLRYELKEVFYSKTKNDCLWILRRDKETTVGMSTMYFLLESSTNWIDGNIDRCTWNIFYDSSKEEINDCSEFDERIQKIKWE